MAKRANIVACHADTEMLSEALIPANFLKGLNTNEVSFREASLIRYWASICCEFVSRFSAMYFSELFK